MYARPAIFVNMISQERFAGLSSNFAVMSTLTQRRTHYILDVIGQTSRLLWPNISLPCGRDIPIMHEGIFFVKFGLKGALVTFWRSKFTGTFNIVGSQYIGISGLQYRYNSVLNTSSPQIPTKPKTSCSY